MSSITDFPVRHNPSDQPDGFAPDVNHVLSAAPQTITPFERDLRLAGELHEPACLILFRAWQLSQLGAADDVTWQTAPATLKQWIRERVDSALAAVDFLRRSQAERESRVRIAQDLRDWFFHYEQSQIGPITRQIVNQTGKSFLTWLQLANPLPSWIWSAERELRQPLTSSPRSQAARVALAGLVPPTSGGAL